MGPSWVEALGLIFGKVYIVWVCAPRYRPLSCRRNRIREKRTSKFGPNFVTLIFCIYIYIYVHMDVHMDVLKDVPRDVLKDVPRDVPRGP